MMVAGTCRNCQMRPVSKAQQLCYRCWCTLDERDPNWANRWPEVGADNDRYRPPPAEPTDAQPGTPEKLAVLIARAAAEVQLHHPLDARLDYGARQETRPAAAGPGELEGGTAAGDPGGVLPLSVLWQDAAG